MAKRTSKHRQINIADKVSVHTSDIQYVRRCKPFGNEALDEIQLLVKLHDHDKIWINLDYRLAQLYYNKINKILEGVDIITIEDVKEAM
jgi:hypothetical protein